jgi:hypothetical protein
MATMAFLGVGLWGFGPGGGERLKLFGIDVREVWSLDLGEGWLYFWAWYTALLGFVLTTRCWMDEGGTCDRVMRTLESFFMRRARLSRDDLACWADGFSSWTCF